MNNIYTTTNRLEYVRQAALQARKDLDCTMQIGDYIAYPGNKKWYEEIHRERNWLEYIDSHLIFPHIWKDFTSHYGIDVRVMLEWPGHDVKMPMDNPPCQVDQGGLSFQYTYRSVGDKPSLIADQLNGNYLALNKPLWDMIRAVNETNRLLSFFDSDTVGRNYTYYPMYEPWIFSVRGRRTSEWEVLKKDHIHKWLDSDSEQFFEVKRIRVRAGDVWPLVRELCAWALFRRLKQIDWEIPTYESD